MSSKDTIREYKVPKSLKRIEAEIHSILELMNDDSERCRVSWVYQTVDKSNRLRYDPSRFIIILLYVHLSYLYIQLLNIFNISTHIGFFLGQVSFLFPN